MDKHKNILLVGGSAPIFSAFLGQIREAGFQVVQRRTSEEAKQFLSEHLVSMVFFSLEDVPSPLERVREFTFLFRGLPVVVVAVKGNVNDARESIAVGAADYLLLPVENSIIQGVLSGFAEKYFDPELGRGRHFITADANMLRLLAQIRRVANSQATVLIQGESGTGKELVARFVHQVSERSQGPFVAINCAALPENLLESELFGHAKGAFTGALADRKGKFQQANGGTIFLDEISEMSLNLQAKLLRVLQEKEVDPVGGRSTVALDVRVIASTNRDLKEWAAQKQFREDLFYRLNVFPVKLPPLRQRVKDIPLLAEHFRKRFTADLLRNDIPFDTEALVVLNSYSWPGNIRELENVVHRALLMAEGSEITADDLMLDIHVMREDVDREVDEDEIRMPVGTTVREMEEFLIRRTLDEVNGNRTRAAELLGISIRTLRNKLNEYATR
ncbi:MAG: sigma-54 dependent transcriptional regulator [Magnetococcus sp. DMHC-6]